jgi:integrase
MISLKDELKEKRNLTDSTVNLYISLLSRMNEGASFNNLSFLKKRKNEIIDFVGQYEASTEKNYLTAAVAALSLYKDSHLYKTAFKFYEDKHRELLIKLGEIDPSIKTEKQANNWMNWKEVEEKWDELNEKVNSFKANKSITKAQFETLVDLLVLSLYVKMSPRRNGDFLNCYIILRPLTEGQKEPTIKNYLNYPEHEFEFNVYKTSKFYGRQNVKIEPELYSILSIWIKFHPLLTGSGKKPAEVPLFVNSVGSRQISVNFITLRLNKIMGKKIGASMLRHIFITDKFSTQIEEMKETASEMGHSLEEQRRYAKKD